ncbi:MAG: hemerythrin domain-containing protein [Pseudomonadota bacterium]|nr:hemerythrin domain-containing protein [Pseudomonadota bacterium]
MSIAKNGVGAAAGAAAVGFIAGMAAHSARKLAHQGGEVLATKGGDWFEILKLEHRMVNALFEQLLKTEEHETKKRAALLLGIKQGLTKHALQEEDVVYPMLREMGVETETKELYSEHADIKTYLHELEQKPKDDPSWLERVRAFHTLIQHHVREEEEEIYPRFKSQMSEEQNKKLTKRMHVEGLLLA